MARAIEPLLKGHGTDARARRHRRNGEKPCAMCLAAEREATARRQMGYIRPYRERARDQHIEMLMRLLFPDGDLTLNLIWFTVRV